VITGKESPTQTAGMIMSAATVGITKTMDFIKSAAGGTGVAGGLNLNAAGVGLKMPESLSAIAGSTKDLISSGNYAANMADKGTGVLGGIPNIADSLKGAAAGAFDKVTAAFKSLGKPGTPLNLTAIKAKNDEEAAAAEAGATTPPADYSLSSMVDKAKSGLGIKSGMTFGQALTAAGDSVKTATGGIVDPTAAIKLGNNAVTALQKAYSTDPSGLSNLPGGAEAVSSAVNLNPSVKALASEVTDSATKLASGSIDKLGLPNVPGLQNIPGSKELTAAVTSVTGALSSSVGGVSDALGGLKSKLGSGTGLQAFASTGLSPSETAKLNSEINSMGAGGPVDVKLPKVANDSFDFSKMKEQAAALLGNPKIPTLPFGSIPAGVFKVPTAAEAQEYDRIKAELTVQEDLQWDLRRAYYDEKRKSGPDSDATVAANNAWKECCQKIMSLKQSLGGTIA
jgi:hypothetical protein